VTEALGTLRGTSPVRPALPEDLRTLAEDYERRLRVTPKPRDIGETASAAERLHSQMHAVRAIAGALDPDPARAAWNVCWTAGYAVGRNFDDQLRLVVLNRCRERAVSGAA
jgi:hypothetical protein